MFIEDEKVLPKDFPFEIVNYQEKRNNKNISVAHRHCFFEITCVLEGRAEYFVNGIRYEVQAGDLILFNHVEEHRWNVLSEEIVLEVLVFSSALVTDDTGGLDTEYLIPFMNRGKSFENRICGSEKAAREVRKIMSEIRMEEESGAIGNRLMIKADILRLLTILVRYYYEKKETSAVFTAKKNEYISRIEKALDYLRVHYNQKITLEEVSATVCMSPNYFSSYFRKATGISFQEYLTKIRIEKAKELLHGTTEGIIDIAQECGIGNTANFYRLYKKYFGISPGKEKKKASGFR